MAEPIVDVECEGKTYTVMKWTQPYFVVGKLVGDVWELQKDEQVRP
jgi:hypothetical protein